MSVDKNKPVYKVIGRLADNRICKSIVNATNRQDAIEQAKKEWPEGTKFTTVLYISPATIKMWEDLVNKMRKK